MSAPERIIVYCDGACRGNPGPASIGVVLYAEGSDEPIAEISKTTGVSTNNVAEYKSLIAGLEKAKSICASRAGWKDTPVTIRMDSELVVKQILGTYRVKNEGLRPLFEEARELFLSFPKRKIEHVPREKNKVADKLANEALDAAG